MATAGAIRGRSVRSAVAAAISEAREAGRLQPWHEPGAAVALKVAAALTRKDVSTTDLTRLSTELRKLLEDLPLAPDPAPKAGDDDRPVAASDRAGEGRPHPIGLATGMGTRPTVGDTALPA
jgi:hypothetical protein